MCQNVHCLLELCANDQGALCFLFIFISSLLASIKDNIINFPFPLQGA
jgi:hypothetical protein